MRISDVSMEMGTRKGAINLVKAIVSAFKDWDYRPIGQLEYETGTKRSMLMYSEDRNSPFEIVELKELDVFAKSHKCCGTDVRVSVDKRGGSVIVGNESPVLTMNIKRKNWVIKYTNGGKKHLLAIIDKLSHWTDARNPSLTFKSEPDSYELITNFIKNRDASESIRYESLSEIDEDRMIELVARSDSGMMSITLTAPPIPIQGRVSKPRVKVDSNHWIFRSNNEERVSDENKNDILGDQDKRASLVRAMGRSVSKNNLDNSIYGANGNSVIFHKSGVCYGDNDSFLLDTEASKSGITIDVSEIRSRTYGHLVMKRGTSEGLLLMNSGKPYIPDVHDLIQEQLNVYDSKLGVDPQFSHKLPTFNSMKRALIFRNRACLTGIMDIESVMKNTIIAKVSSKSGVYDRIMFTVDNDNITINWKTTSSVNDFKLWELFRTINEKF